MVWSNILYGNEATDESERSEIKIHVYKNTRVSGLQACFRAFTQSDVYSSQFPKRAIKLKRQTDGLTADILTVSAPVIHAVLLYVPIVTL